MRDSSRHRQRDLVERLIFGDQLEDVLPVQLEALGLLGDPGGGLGRRARVLEFPRSRTLHRPVPQLPPVRLVQTATLDEQERKESRRS